MFFFFFFVCFFFVFLFVFFVCLFFFFSIHLQFDPKIRDRIFHVLLFNFVDLAMRIHVPTLLLGLMSGLATADQHGVGSSYAGDAVSKDFGVRERHANIETDKQRQRRGTSPALTAWAKLVKTTLSFRWLHYSDGSKFKTFIKIGSVDDAIADFNSLGPTRIQHVGDAIIGKAGNQAVILLLRSSGIPRATLQFGNKSPRTIRYCDTREQALLESWYDLRSSIPTVH